MAALHRMTAHNRLCLARSAFPTSPACTIRRDDEQLAHEHPPLIGAESSCWYRIQYAIPSRLLSTLRVDFIATLITNFLQFYDPYTSGTKQAVKFLLAKKQSEVVVFSPAVCESRKNGLYWPLSCSRWRTKSQIALKEKPSPTKPTELPTTGTSRPHLEKSFVSDRCRDGAERSVHF